VSCHFEGGVGTRSLLEAGFTADAAICGEPTDNTIGTVHRGAAYLKITTFGKQAHTSAKELGLNAIETMEPILAAMRKLEGVMPYEPHPDLPGGPNLNIGTIRGGTKHNQVPDRCEMTCDIRLLPSQDPYDVKIQVEQMVSELKVSDPRIEAIVEFSDHWLSGPRLPYEIDKNSPISRTVAKAVQEAGISPVYQGIQFWTDMVPLKQFGIPSVNVGPGTPPYSWADEWVELAKYREIIEIYNNAVHSWCR
jgi:acetylornithine deacetylase/succinyl-diaminopimelate desuccinylase-like protein